MIVPTAPAATGWADRSGALWAVDAPDPRDLLLAIGDPLLRLGELSPKPLVFPLKPLLDDSHKRRVVAMVRGKPPEGRARWTVRLVAEEAVKRKLVPHAGRERIRALLESYDVKPWREGNVVRGGTGREVHPEVGGRTGGL